MRGRTRKLIDEIIEKRSGGDPTLATITRTKLILKGIDPDKFDYTTVDDPAVLQKVEQIARNTGVMS